MLTLFENHKYRTNNISRRDFLSVGALGCLSLTDVLRAQDHEDNPRKKSVILIHMTGGPSQLESYDLKPLAPSDYRGEFRPIPTNVPGVEICELLPLQSQIMDKIAIIRDLQFHNELPFDHDPHEVFSGYSRKFRRPPIGSIVSRLHPSLSDALPPYVSLCKHKLSISERLHPEDPLYAGSGHRPFAPIAMDMENLQLQLPAGRLQNRRELLKQLDLLRRDLDHRGNMAGMDTFSERALAMMLSPEALTALDIEKEPESVRERYGSDHDYYFNSFPGNTPFIWQSSKFLVARRLVEAGVPVVTMNIGEWDHHGVLSNGPKSDIVTQMNTELPWFDRAFSALIRDLDERGLLDDVLVVAWGEMGRTPKINRQAGRDHWQDSGFALIAGGGLKTGQAVGQTDRHAARPVGNPHTPEHVFATIYRHLGIDPTTTLLDFSKRPRPLIDDNRPILELI